VQNTEYKRNTTFGITALSTGCAENLGIKAKKLIFTVLNTSDTAIHDATCMLHKTGST
jgi:hypothetical protein